MKKLLILMLLGVLFVPMVGSAKADEVLYCQSELATGMAKQNGTWVTGSFQLKRYTIKVSGDFEKLIGILENETFDCRVPYEWNPEQTVCQHESGMSFFYDKSSKRFLLSFTNVSTYLTSDTPALYAGTCQKF